MKTLSLLAAVLTLASSAFAAKTTKVLYEEKDGGVVIVRDQALAQAVKNSDKTCTAYAEARNKADAAPASSKRREQREKAFLEREATRLLAECVNADEAAKRALAGVLGERAESVEKAAGFEDMVYVQLASDVASLDGN